MKYIKSYEKAFTIKECDEFIRYMLSFYGKDEGLYRDIFNNELTKDIIEKYVYSFIDKRTDLDQWGGGDSFDREIFRDVLLVKLGIHFDTEYRVTEYLTKKDIKEMRLKKAVKKYNL